jgi:hypothetical protein
MRGAVGQDGIVDGRGEERIPVLGTPLDVVHPMPHIGQDTVEVDHHEGSRLGVHAATRRNENDIMSIIGSF